LNNILHDIVEAKKEEVKLLKRDFTYKRFADSEFFEKNSLSFFNALNNKNRISIIAEIKKASPSKGLLLENFDHIKIASIYFENEADAISILTDKNFFQGNIKYLNDIAKIKSAPLLRKDFIIDEFQIFETKSNGADAILLISEILSENQIKELTQAAQEHYMDVLLELHSSEQISKIDFSINKIIGINNRDLSNFNVDIKTTHKISELLPDDILIVSESGIRNKNDIDFLKTTNTSAVLVGEHFMKSKNIAEALKEFKEYCSYES